MKKKLGWGIAMVLAIYALLLAALFAAESAHEASNIRSFADALWYSLVTISTVGYGDLYPVTPAGRAIGVFFLLLSLGFLAFIVSTVFSLISGRFWPGLILRARRNRPWFLFSGVNDASLALAENLAKEYPGSLQIFCSTSREEEKRRLHRRYVCLADDAAQVMDRFGAHYGSRSVFLISGDDYKNCDEAHALRECGARLYCRSEEIRGMTDVSFFNPFDSCARLFWNGHPLLENEKCVLLIGNGRYARSMLSSAIVTNCATPVRTVQYHLFDDWKAYLSEHYCLDRALAVNRESDTTDALFFHEGPWTSKPELIERADRIIFCFDDDDENARCAHLLERCFVHGAKVYVRTSRQVIPGTRFGAVENLYTPELVMKHRLDRIAMQMHERYCCSVDKSVPGWNELDSFMRESNRAAADHIPTKIRLLLGSDAESGPQDCRRAARCWQQVDDKQREICRQNEHDRWVRFYCLYNWQYAPVRNDGARRHPSMLPYEQLSEQERAKDDYAWQLLDECAQIQEQL